MNLSSIYALLSLPALLLIGCGSDLAPPPQSADRLGDWPLAGDIIRDNGHPHSFRASRTVMYPQVLAVLAEPDWGSSPEAPVGTLSLWFHLGSDEIPAGTKLKVVGWDGDPLHHCVHEKVDAPSIEARYVELVRGNRAFPADGDPQAGGTTGELVLDAPSSTARGANGHLDVTLTDPAGHTRHLFARVQFDAPTQMWNHEADACPKG